MAMLSLSHMPLISHAYVHLPRRSVAQSSLDIPAKICKASTTQARKPYLRYLHLLPASQTMQIKPEPCFLFTSTRRRTQSPLRTVVTQDRAETVPPYARSRRRLQRLDHSFARDALSDASRSHSRMILLPSRRTAVTGSRYEHTADD
jgi:hypothetical protein